MFNFIFEGKIGDILAPIQSPLQQYHLAIQHHKNGEVEQIILSGTVEIGNTSNAGYADIHIACRYNNKYVLNILLSKGIPVNHLDKSGNTPLHYAAKYGHIDICRFLIEANAAPAARNSQGQSPYDVSDNHIIRQYLLPLQLSSERDMNPAAANAMPPPPTSGFLQGGAAMMNSFFPPGSGSSSGIPVYAPPTQYPPPNQTLYAPPPLPTNPNQVPYNHPSVPVTSAPPPVQSQTSIPSPPSPVGRPNVFVNTSTNLPGVQSTTPTLPESVSPPPVLQHSTSGNENYEISQSPNPVASWNSTISSAPSSTGSQTSTTNRRVIQPASKASLKEKYGHTKIATAIAPPPIFGAPQVGASSTLGPPNLYQNTQGTQPPYLLNRYVPYDPNIPPVPYAQPNYPPVYQQSSFPTANQSESSFVPPPVYSTFPPPQPAATIPAPIQTTETTGSIPSTRLTNSPRIHVNADNVFNPVTDRVVSATSSSSAIL